MSHALRVRFDKCIKIIWKYQFVLIMGGQGLTGKQKRHCEELILDWNHTRAALAAGYSKSTAEKKSYSWVGKSRETSVYPEMYDYVQELQKDLSRVSGVTPLRNLLALKRIGYTNLADLKDDWTTLKDWNDLTPDQKSCISEIVTTETKKGDIVTTTTKIKVHNPKDYIAEMNKMIGAYPAEKVEVTGKNGGAIVVNNIDDETLLEEIEKYKMICDNTEGK